MAPQVVNELVLSPFIGTLITFLLYGATIIQVWQYYTDYPRDPPKMKYLVAFVFVMETVHTASTAHYISFSLIENFGKPEMLRRIPWSLAVSVAFGFIIAWTVNLFFVRRVYVLSKKNTWLAVVISILATLRPAFGLAAGLLTVAWPDWLLFKSRAQWLMITGLSLGLVVDCLIAFCVSYQLLKGQSVLTGPTRSIVKILVKYTINTGAILTLFALMELIGLVASPKSLAFLGLFEIQIQLYANCFLTNLNARQSIRAETAQLVTLSPRCSRPPQARLAGGIRIKTETSTTSDSPPEGSADAIAEANGEKMSPISAV